MRMLSLATVLALTASAAIAEPFTVIALGDMPYGNEEDVYPPFEQLISTINARTPELVIHVGDTKSSRTPCSDQWLDQQLAYLNTFDAPTLYTPGDNEWTDCYIPDPGAEDPLERLAHIRSTYFADPTRSFGRRQVALTHQGDAGYPENVRTEMNGVLFMTAHVVGSNNNFEIRDLAAVEEFMARDAANLDWLRQGFAAAAEADALVLAIHANMFDFDFDIFGRQDWLRHSGFRRFGTALKTEAAEFGKPVLLVYGDSHVFRQSRPFPYDAPNVLALEVPGARHMHAVEITIDPDTSGVFAVTLVENPALAK